MIDLEKTTEIAAKILTRAVEMIIVLADKNGFNREIVVKDAIEVINFSIPYFNFEKYKVSEQAIKEFEDKFRSEDV